MRKNFLISCFISLFVMLLCFYLLLLTEIYNKIPGDFNSSQTLSIVLGVIGGIYSYLLYAYKHKLEKKYLFLILLVVLLILINILAMKVNCYAFFIIFFNVSGL